MAGGLLGPGDVKAAFGRVGVGEGDCLFLHADASAAAPMRGRDAAEKMESLIQGLEELLGAEGSLVMPAFTYSFTRGQDFDQSNSPSTVGMLTEHFRQRPGVLRSSDPLFSVAASGARAEELAGGPCPECFGPESVFARLHRRGGVIGFLGCGLQVATFLHYVERCLAVSYRYNKTFSGRIIDGDGRVREARAVYFVRRLEDGTEADLRVLERRLMDSGALRRAELGRVRVMAVSTEDFFEHTRRLVEENPLGLTKKGLEHMESERWARPLT